MLELEESLQVDRQRDYTLWQSLSTRFLPPWEWRSRSVWEDRVMLGSSNRLL